MTTKRKEPAMSITITDVVARDIRFPTSRSFDGSDALKRLVIGRDLDAITANMGAFWRVITGDSHLRWLGPEKGVMHLATAAIVNAVWDLWAKAEGKPVWKLLADMTPEQVVACIDFRYITDALTPEEALAMLRRNAPTKATREAQMRQEGYPA